MASLEELKRKLEGDKPKDKIVLEKDKSISKEKTIAVKPAKNGRNYIPTGKKGRNGGRPPNEETLVERGIRAKIDEYCEQEMELEVKDPQTGQTRKVKKPRIMWAVETFFTVGMNLAQKGEFSGIQTLDKFLDRSLGKASQPIRGEGEDAPPISLHINNLRDILRKAYGSDNPD